MPKYKIRNAFYWNNLGVKNNLIMNLASLCHIIKEKNLFKNSTKTASWKRIKHSHYWKMNFGSKLLVLDIQ